MKPLPQHLVASTGDLIEPKAFSEKTRAYHQYQARQNYWRQQQSIQNHLNALLAQAERERAEKERERAEKEAALAEIERFKALLRN